MKGATGKWVLVLPLFLPFSTATAWGYYFDDRRETSLAGFFYTRAVIATQDAIAGQKALYSAGNVVSHRSFGSLEFRHKIERVTQEFPTIGPFFQFLNLNAFDYYLNLRAEYDGIYDYGPNKIRKLLSGTNLHVPYWDDPKTSVPFDGAYFTPGGAPDYPMHFISLTNRRWLRKLRKPRIRLFEGYFNLAKGPLFIRIGRQNLSWGETDGFRLLDLINPLDNTFGGFLTSLDERRIPLNMLRAQWNFGTVGPITDLTLEGFYSIDNKVSPVLPAAASYFWAGPAPGNATFLIGRTPCGGDFMAKRGIPPYEFTSTDPRLQARFGGLYRGSGPGPRHGGGCSVASDHPKANLEDGRGGGRILGTVADFTWSIAHYYTYPDAPAGEAMIISPTPDHLRWDLGLPTDSRGHPWADNLVNVPGIGTVNIANPWGPSDPVAARMISSGSNPAGRGGIASLAGAERNVRSRVDYQRIQITGGSLSFPLSAFTGLFVGPESPLFYIYSTIRAEVAYFNNVPTQRAFAHGDGATAFDRFLGGALNVAGGAFKPGGPLADQAGHRKVHLVKRDYLAWNIGVDHNQWVRWLNPYNTFSVAAQLFWTNRNGQDTQFDRGSPPSVLNDRDAIGVRKREAQNPRSASFGRTGLTLFNFGGQDILTTVGVSTQYWGGNLRPSLNFFYDWSGSWLIQPGVDWTFWDPFRLSVRYAWLDGRGNRGIGALNRKDNVWFELQYVLY